MTLKVIDGGVDTDKATKGLNTVSFTPKTGKVISVNEALVHIEKLSAEMEFEPIKGDDGKWVYAAYLKYPDGRKADVINNRSVQPKTLQTPQTLYNFIVRHNPGIEKVVIPVLPEDD